MVESNFLRVETKYLLDKNKMKTFLKEINPYVEKDKFYKSNIKNIYFDNENNDLIIRSLQKPVYKNKYRLRYYETPNPDTKVFLETKVKYNHLVSKRRILIKLKDFYSYMKTGKYESDDQIFKELDYSFKYYNLKPYIYIAYDRLSYREKDNYNLRITFDSNIRYRFSNLILEDDNNCTNLTSKDEYILEIKSISNMPLWLTEILNRLEIYPVSFSKIGKIYESINRKEIKC